MCFSSAAGIYLLFRRSRLFARKKCAQIVLKFPHERLAGQFMDGVMRELLRRLEALSIMNRS